MGGELASKKAPTDHAHWPIGGNPTRQYFERHLRKRALKERLTQAVWQPKKRAEPKLRIVLSKIMASEGDI